MTGAESKHLSRQVLCHFLEFFPVIDADSEFFWLIYLADFTADSTPKLLLWLISRGLPHLLADSLADSAPHRQADYRPWVEARQRAMAGGAAEPRRAPPRARCKGAF